MTFNVCFRQDRSLNVSFSDGLTLGIGFGDGVTVGTLADTYKGAYVVTPRIKSETVLDTDGLLMTDDVTVNKVPVWETSNTKGLTVFIGND